MRAELHVRSDVPADLRHGLFAAPATYAAWVRFSSSHSGPALATDAKPDAHGMAIKVLGVPGLKVLTRERDALTQDFLLANSPVFFVRNPADYLDLVNDKDQGHFLRFFVGVDPRRWHPRELANVLLATRKVIGNPLDCLYWSQTPYALGPLEVKYAARPTTGHPDPVVRSGGPDGLAATMADQLRSGPWSFDLMVQCRTDDARMPVEDPTVRWSERRSPFVPVATVVMEPQDLSAPERAALAENLAFTPWHSLPAHRPLGGINRVRRAVYEATSDARRQLNGVDPIAEPTE